MSKVLAPILFFIIAIGLFFSYLRPAYSELGASKERLKKLEQVIVESDQLLNNYDTLRGKRSAISEIDMKNLYKILPDSVDAVRLILDLDALATKHNLVIGSFDVPDIESELSAVSNKSATAKRNTSSTDTENKVIGSAVLTIECTGTYEDFKPFLADIERSLSLADVVALDVAVPEATEKNNPAEEITYTLGLQIYWLKDLQ